MIPTWIRTQIQSRLYCKRLLDFEITFSTCTSLFVGKNRCDDACWCFGLAIICPFSCQCATHRKAIVPPNSLACRTKAMQNRRRNNTINDFICNLFNLLTHLSISFKRKFTSTHTPENVIKFAFLLGIRDLDAVDQLDSIVCSSSSIVNSRRERFVRNAVHATLIYENIRCSLYAQAPCINENRWDRHEGLGEIPM